MRPKSDSFSTSCHFIVLSSFRCKGVLGQERRGRDTGDECARGERADKPREPLSMSPSRRGFLKGLVVGTGVASQVGCKTADPIKTQGTTKTTTVCPFCGVGCGQIAFTRGDKLVHVEGDPDHPISEGTLCSKGAAIGQISNNPHRRAAHQGDP